jgi:hypothetical protein
MRFPVRLILIAYGLAAGLGAAAWLAGAGGLAAAGLFWLGGSAALFALPALLPALRGEAPGPDPEARAAMLAEWDLDLEAERGAARRRRAG